VAACKIALTAPSASEKLQIRTRKEPGAANQSTRPEAVLKRGHLGQNVFFNCLPSLVPWPVQQAGGESPQPVYG
jgi:hypothetical protein